MIGHKEFITTPQKPPFNKRGANYINSHKKLLLKIFSAALAACGYADGIILHARTREKKRTRARVYNYLITKDGS